MRAGHVQAVDAGRLVQQTLLAVGGAVFGIAAVVQADIPDNGVIHGCYAKFNLHSLRVIDTSKGEHCFSNEIPLDWNASGGTGATGPTGPTGPSGLTQFANVKDDGTNVTLVNGTATGVTHLGIGTYEVTFVPDVSGCGATVSPKYFGSNLVELVGIGHTNPGANAHALDVNIAIQTALGPTSANSSFSLVLAC